MIHEDDDDECLPIPRRSLVDRYQLKKNNLSPNNEISSSDRRQSRLSLNNSISIDENFSTSKQLIDLYEQTIELVAQNKINIKNAFHFPLVERLLEISNVIASDPTNHHEPNFIKVGSVIDTSAKIYGLCVDALHTETQRLSGSIQFQDDEEELNNSDQPKIIKKPIQHYKSNSYLVSDLSTISLPYEFEFHPLQPSNMCKWPGGYGLDSIYADMVSYTMYSLSDFPRFIDLNSRINYINNETILDITAKTMYDLIPLREVIKENEGENHILGCQILREFTFNEESTESYIETIDECSIMDSLNDEDDQNILSDLRDEPTSFYFQELQSTYTCPMTMPSMDKTSFVDHLPYLLREQTDQSDYSYFDAAKLKLFAGPYAWKYTNLLPDLNENIPIIRHRMTNNNIRSAIKSTRNFKLDLFNYRSLNELMNPLSKSIIKRRKRTRLLSVSKHNHQLRLTRRLRSLNELITSNNFPDIIFDDNLQILPDDYPINDVPDYDDPPMEYDFIRPIHYDKIEFDKNFTKIDTKKLQYELVDEYNTEYSKSSSIPITFSNLCLNLIDKNLLSIDKTELISAFYCMLNNCNKKNLFMKTNNQQDDLIIQKQSFINSLPPLSYTQSFYL